MRGIAVVLLALGLCVPAALAAKGDPQKKFTPAGQAHARAAAFRKSDFPSTFKQGPAKQQNTNEASPRCSYYNPDQSDLVEIGEYESPDFDLADGSSVSSTTGVFKTAKMAKAGYSRVAKPALPKCLAELFGKGVSAGAGAANKATIFSARAMQFPSYGDTSNAYRIVASVKTPSARVRVYLDVFVFNRGATDVAVLALGIAKPLPTALEQSLMSKLASRA